MRYLWDAIWHVFGWSGLAQVREFVCELLVCMKTRVVRYFFGPHQLHLRRSLFRNECSRLALTGVAARLGVVPALSGVGGGS